MSAPFKQAQAYNVLRLARVKEGDGKTSKRAKKSKKTGRAKKYVRQGVNSFFPRYRSYVDERDLHAAAGHGSRSMVATLVKKNKKRGGVNCKSRGHPNETPLHTACTTQQAKIVSLLLKKGADLTVGDVFGNTAMHRCARFNSVDCAKALLEKQSDWSNARNIDGLNPLQIAIKNEHLDMVLLLQR